VVGRRFSVVGRKALTVTAVGLVAFLAFYHLAEFPLTWFDEGSHLHVPKTLVRFGAYADYSSEGFRFYGPTVGVGPTVMLPIAAIFRLFGIGLLQARVVMALYLLAAIYAFYRLALLLGGRRLAWVATALLIASRGTALLEYGRQALGEVPGLFFLLAGLVLWFRVWEQARWWQLGLVGVLLGLSMVTKQQYLLVLAPTLLAAWLLNLIYYRSAPQRIFLAPGIVAAACYAVWQVCLVFFLGPGTATENLKLFREFTAGAALVFSFDLMQRGISELLSLKVYLSVLAPVLLYGASLAIPRRREGQQWGVLFVLVVWNLVWYVVASVSWLRYAFPALAVASLFVARFFHDLTDGFRWNPLGIWDALRRGDAPLARLALQGTLLAWLAAMIVVPLGKTAWQIVSPTYNAPAAMAAYLNENVPREALIETWEPELGFLTDHNYHFPPQILLNTAVKYVWQNGTPPAQEYNFVQTEQPEYVLVGAFAQWVGMYPPELLAGRYALVTRIGAYELYAVRR
jgi:4-amino-4-deoxy-L-arabinose transferase-like glycosyltransferase